MEDQYIIRSPKVYKNERKNKKERKKERKRKKERRTTITETEREIRANKNK
jgi:hypothetical protein